MMYISFNVVYGYFIIMFPLEFLVYVDCYEKSIHASDEKLV